MRMTLSVMAAAPLVFCCAVSCGGDEFVGGSAGSGGEADASAGTGGGGTGGSAGSGGSAGTGGVAGTGGGAGTGGVAGTGGIGGTGGSAGTGGVAGSGGGPGEPPCDPTEVPASDAIFVSPTGSDSQSGTPLLPVQTLGAAILKAKSAMATHIYLEQGTYPVADTLQFTSAEAGLIIEGGWDRSGTTWTPICGPNRRDYTVVTVGSTMAVRVMGTATPTSMRHMVIATRAEGDVKEAQDGESMYGVHVSGAGTVFNLFDIGIISGNAADGGEFSPTPGATGAQSCNGHAGCCTASTPGCGTAAGPNPPPDQPSGPAADESGSFAATGWIAEHGTDGAPGAPGFHGKEGAAGQSSTLTCRVGGNCGFCSDGAGNDACPGTCQHGTPSTSTTPLVGETGRCGCGGVGGLGGRGGRGGGASVALFIADGADVSVAWSVLQAGDGGDGANGASGGEGALGANGIDGAAASCVTGCYVECFGSCGCTQVNSAAGGGAGTKGGRGGLAADGGGGPGGPSYAIVTVAAGYTDSGNNELAYGSSGVGADGAASGAVGDWLQSN